MLGQRYSLLPSEILNRATTFDLEVLDIALSYEQYKRDKAQGKPPEYKQEDLMEIMKIVK
jgi:hypothetical protein